MRSGRHEGALEGGCGVDQKIERAVAECVKRSEAQTELDRVDKRLGDVDESLKAITAQLESLQRQFAEQNKNTQAISGRCDANAQGISSVQTLLGNVEKGTEEVTTRVESFEKEVVRLSREMAKVSLPFVRTSFTGKELEIMTKGVNALKHWTRLSEATLVYDSKADEFTDDGLFDKVKGKPNIALIGFTTDGDVFGGFYSLCCDEARQVLLGPEHLCFLVRVGRAVHDAAAVRLEGRAEGEGVGEVLQER